MIKITVEISHDKELGRTKAITRIDGADDSKNPEEHLLGEVIVVAITEALNFMKPDDTVYGKTTEEVEAKAKIARDVRRAVEPKDFPNPTENGG